ncbi:MAG: hypothetical protein RLZZ618_2684 [Pseudomonadota bacterium]|jgi:hypothetical protein
MQCAGSTCAFQNDSRYVARLARISPYPLKEVDSTVRFHRHTFAGIITTSLLYVTTVFAVSLQFEHGTSHL